MKLKGILSSKRRRTVHERNQSLAAPAASASALSTEYHKPTSHADGSLACSCGGMRYSPAAFAAHLAGRGVTDAEGAVYTVGRSDPWLDQQRPERKLQADEAAGAAWREEMIAAYWDQQQQAKQRVADGVGKSAFFD